MNEAPDAVANTTEQPRADHLKTGLADDGSLRWVAADLSLTLEEVRRRLDLSPLSSIALGRALTGAVLLHRISLKVPASLSLEVHGDGPLARVFAEVDTEGHLRGTVSKPHLLPSKEDEGWNLANAIGNGTLTVTRDTERGRYSSKVELVSGELGDDFTHYLEQSEQIRSAVLLGVLPKSTGIAAAGGIIVEALPGTDVRVIQELERNIRLMEGVSKTLERGGVNSLAEALFGDFEREEIEHRPLSYQCRCDRESLAQRLRLLPKGDFSDLFNRDEECEAVCGFCGERYIFSKSELVAN